MDKIPLKNPISGVFDSDPGDENQLMPARICGICRGFRSKLKPCTTKLPRVNMKLISNTETQARSPMPGVTVKSLVKIGGPVSKWIYRNFFPKPFFGHNGSGMHVYQSIWKGKENMCFDENESTKISEFLRYFIGDPTQICQRILRQPIHGQIPIND